MNVLSEEHLAQIWERFESSTPLTKETTKRTYYDHGGGRLSVDKDLILDAFDENNREFYFNAREDVASLLLELTRLTGIITQCEALVKELKEELADSDIFKSLQEESTDPEPKKALTNALKI